MDKALTERQIAGGRADLDERLTLPGAAEGIVVGKRTGQRPRQRPAMAFRPQAQVDAIGQAAVRVGRQQADDFAHDLGEKLVIGNAGCALTASRAVLVVDEHQVDVATVIQLLTAVFAEREYDAGDGLAGFSVGLAEAIADGAQGGGQCDFQRHIGGARDVTSDFFKGPVADHVVGANAQQLPLAKTAEDAQDRRVLEGGIHLGLKRGLHLSRAGAAAQRHAQHVEIIGVGAEQVAERLTDAE